MMPMLEFLLTTIAVLMAIILTVITAFIVATIVSKIWDIIDEIKSDVEYQRKVMFIELAAKENKRKCENIKKMFPEKYEEYKKKGLMK